MQPKPIEEFEKATGLIFRDKRLLQQAFTHRSYVNERAESGETIADNERLEFLGDTVLQFVVSDLLYSQFPDHQEGKLTHIRTTLIYVDAADLDAVRTFAMPQIEAELALTHGATKDPKSRFQEWGQESFGFTPRYKQVAEIGPDHNKIFVMRVDINNKPFGVGMGRSKGEASQNAAAMALHRHNQPAPEYVMDNELESKYGF